MKKDCSKYSTLITGFIDEELDSKEMSEVQRHMEECPNCQESYAQESNVKRIVKQKVAVTHAPGYLHTRVRRHLLREGHRPGFWEIIRSLFVYRPATASFALAVIGILVIFPIYRYGLLQNDLIQREPMAAELTGEVICLDCELSKELQHEPHHDPVTHHAGLRAADGRIWTFLESTDRDNLNAHPELFKKKISVQGILFQNAQYVQVEGYKVL